MLLAAVEENAALRAFPQRAVDELEKITGLMNERVGYAAAPDLGTLNRLLSGLAGLMPADGSAASGEASYDEAAGNGDDASSSADAPASAAAPRRVARSAGLAGSVDSREDALRAIDMVCAYLDRTEPTNPAQFFLRRARKLVDKNFLELVRELAPESLDQVARVMGVSAEELGGSSY
jgi:type VI secretion system protein ImpA